jgi:Putative peptidoglycan binding domain
MSDFEAGNLENANLKGDNLKGDNLIEAKPESVDLIEAKLESAKLEGDGFLELKIRLINDLDQPIKMSKYRLEVDNQKFEGITNNEGILQHDIPLGAKTGKLILDKKLFHRREKNSGEINVENWSIDLHIVDSMAPDDSIAGIQARLNNLGFFASKEIHEQYDEQTRRAIQRFQTVHPPLKVTGKIDQETKKRLEEVYGS